MACAALTPSSAIAAVTGDVVKDPVRDVGEAFAVSAPGTTAAPRAERTDVVEPAAGHGAGATLSALPPGHGPLTVTMQPACSMYVLTRLALRHAIPVRKMGRVVVCSMFDCAPNPYDAGVPGRTIARQIDLRRDFLRPSSRRHRSGNILHDGRHSTTQLGHRPKQRHRKISCNAVRNGQGGPPRFLEPPFEAAVNARGPRPRTAGRARTRIDILATLRRNPTKNFGAAAAGAASPSARWPPVLPSPPNAPRTSARAASLMAELRGGGAVAALSTAKATALREVTARRDAAALEKIVGAAILLREYKSQLYVAKKRR